MLPYFCLAEKEQSPKPSSDWAILSCMSTLYQYDHGMPLTAMPNPELITGVQEKELPIFLVQSELFPR